MSLPSRRALAGLGVDIVAVSGAVLVVLGATQPRPTSVAVGAGILVVAAGALVALATPLDPDA